jgi:biotin-[acetyl-CoA-carboxylase] ligase BirA-like protein
VVPRHVFDVVDSTQRRAVALARAGAPVGTRVVAARQLEGRGRSDDRWVSPPGGLYLSLIGPEAPSAGSLTPIALGAGLHELLASRYGVRTELKWPNDLLHLGPSGARKLAGVLTDRIAGTEGDRTVVGTGINVAVDRDAFPPELRGEVAFLGEVARPAPSLRELEEEVAARELEVLRDLANPRGRTRWLAIGRRAFFGRGRVAIVDGERLGTIQELGEDGALWVAAPTGPIAVRVGGLRVGEAT